MSTNSYSTVTYTGDGATATFSIPFPYLEQADIVVSVNDVVTSFTFLSDTQVLLPAAPAYGAVVEIARNTDIAKPSIVFADGAALTQDDLNTAEDQMLYGLQEVVDQVNYWAQWIQTQAFSGGGGGGGTGSSLPAVSNVNNGSILVAWDSAWNIYNLVEGRSLLGIPIAGCGNVAGLTVGISTGEVPTADQLGQAAWHAVGTTGTDLVPYSSFANGAFTTVGGGVGQLATWIDLGGGTAGYPPKSGQAITNILHDLQYTRLEYQTAYNTNGGAYTTSPSFANVGINTVCWDDTGAFSLSSSIITIPAGTYDYRARIFVKNMGYCIARLVDTNGNPIYPQNNPGPTVVSGNTDGGGADYAEVSGKFGVSVATLAYLQIAGSTSANSADTNLGVAHGESAWGTNTYATLEFWKHV